ncbi:1485_t:CDS:1 [Ambispora gerdemannii]|uniref:1485_t:CDS:1 n=1 Tax=Ambispora gerdemannii TaxID=144530 RepID=A0A9N9DBJ9_9GLOM|nr:1485_t:CDS:1 [Ambispora gerdemannii]
MNSSISEIVNEITTVNFNDSNNPSITTRPFVFIESSNPANPKQTITHSDTSLIFRPPFPPALEADDIFGKKSDGTNPTKPPNAFILYRRAFVKSALANGYKLPMTVISSMASQAWGQELPFIKEEYKKIAKEAKKNHDLLFPKTPKIKESKRWRVYPIKPRNKSTPEQTTPLTANKESLMISEPSTPAPEIDNETEWEQLFNFYVDPNKEKNDEQNVFIWEDFLENYDNNTNQVAIEAQCDAFLDIEISTPNIELTPEMNGSLDSFYFPIELSDFRLPEEYEPLNFFVPQDAMKPNYSIENLNEQLFSFLPIF